MQKIDKIFGKKQNIIIGAIHFPPLLGYKDFTGFETALKNAHTDLMAFIKGGVDGVIFENNYDNPHSITVDPSVVVSMMYLGTHLRHASKLPMGVNVLWNDFYASLSIAKTINLPFVRIPVFVDTVKTECGIVRGNADEILRFRKKINAVHVVLFTDIHVKHSKLLSKNDLVTSAKLAIKNKSDALIITGDWTGQAPATKEIRLLRKKVGNFPIFVGSGANIDNIRDLLQYANGVIVSTSLKTGGVRASEKNVKNYNQRISKLFVKNLVQRARRS